MVVSRKTFWRLKLKIVAAFCTNFRIAMNLWLFDMSYFAYACKTEGKNGISRLISELLRTLDSSLRDRLFVLQNEVF